MTAEFDWWLLILGLVIGAGLVWLILAELARRDVEIGEAELEVEAAWIAAQLRPTDRRWDSAAVTAVLREHRAYLKLPPPDDAPDAAAPDAAMTSALPDAAAAPPALSAMPSTPWSPSAASSPSATPADGDRASASPG